MILDTEFIVSIGRDEAEATSLAADLEARNAPMQVPTIVIEELYVSVGAGVQSDANAQKYEALVANKPVVDLDEKIARRAGALRGERLKSDVKADLGTADAVVAATGLAHDEPVVSNDGDFQDVEGLTVETY